MTCSRQSRRMRDIPLDHSLCDGLVSVLCI